MCIEMKVASPTPLNWPPLAISAAKDQLIVAARCAIPFRTAIDWKNYRSAPPAAHVAVRSLELLVALVRWLDFGVSEEFDSGPPASWGADTQHWEICKQHCFYTLKILCSLAGFSKSNWYFYALYPTWYTRHYRAKHTIAALIHREAM